MGAGDVTEYNWRIGPSNSTGNGTVPPEPEPAPPGYDTNSTQGLEIPNVAAHLWYFRQVTGCDLTNSGIDGSIFTNSSSINATATGEGSTVQEVASKPTYLVLNESVNTVSLKESSSTGSTHAATAAVSNIRLFGTQSEVAGLAAEAA